ncbi:MAG: hypothetical protein H6821_13805 [Planctomycetaceae bacterium]|nr:hypothetical protein [Planctomycetales bacterium]MCB9875244.1 hypothetical protein [Planctomycetaceae bacterium]MCB9938860.1 hypothetical protein [Planctomycetaceae bacterium]HRX77628.1 hypothetical protein [Pirellulaceae bacterium]
MKLLAKSKKSKRHRRGRTRRFVFESLEDRHMLAADCLLPDSGATDTDVTAYVDCLASEM